RSSSAWRSLRRGLGFNAQEQRAYDSATDKEAGREVRDCAELRRQTLRCRKQARNSALHEKYDESAGSECKRYVAEQGRSKQGTQYDRCDCGADKELMTLQHGHVELKHVHLPRCD